ncbi:MAG: hypothetical protein DRI34_10160 [Deltaproteobacteria bacterium]|nr:MAG: hypothetical protein DRI34_10160 [Deltaproteobacteria bacterium]
MNAGEEIRHALVFENASSGRVLLLLLALILAWWWYRRGLLHSRSTTRRLLLMSLRGVNLLLLAGLLLGPVLEKRQLARLTPRLVLLVDASASMNIATGQGPSRLQRVQDWLQENLPTAAAGSGLSWQLYGFDSQVAPAGSKSLRPPGNGQGSDILGALEEVVRQVPAGGGGELSAIVLVSDGADTGVLGGITGHQEVPEWLTRRLHSLGVVVNTVAVGAGEEFVDLSLGDIEFDPFAFVRNAVEIAVTVRAVGTGKLTVPVTLTRQGRVLDTSQVTVRPGRSGRAVLRFVPDEVGKFVFRVSLPQVAGDAIPGNNVRSFVTRVVRDKTRVLHVVGRPSWDVRFLRELLRRDQSIDLVSFYILRTTIDAPGVGEGELSLIPFPVSKLFGSELDTFDLVILQNFNHGPYSVGLYLGEIADYVRRGGALCMIGGDLSFAAGGYSGTVLEQVLPVRLQAGNDLRPEEFRPVPLADNALHPVLAVGREDAWQHLPSLGSYNRAAGLADTATSLLVHPFDRVAGGRAPLLAVRQVDRGRSAALLTDGSWRWRLAAASEPNSGRLYQRFWNNLIRWLIRDPAMEPLSLRADTPQVSAGRPIRLRLASSSLRAGPLELRLRNLDDGSLREASSLEVSGGQSELSLPPQPPGAYLVEVVKKPSGRVLAREVVVVEAADLEQRHAEPRADLLEMLARQTGGRFSSLEDARLEPGRLTMVQHTRLVARVAHPLLARGWLLGLLIALWALEWLLRRRWGYA